MAYRYLADWMQLPEHMAHFSMMNSDQCRKAIDLLSTAHVPTQLETRKASAHSNNHRRLKRRRRNHLADAESREALNGY